jgi:intracellular multiplication protein IcmK
MKKVLFILCGILIVVSSVSRAEDHDKATIDTDELTRQIKSSLEDSNAPKSQEQQDQAAAQENTAALIDQAVTKIAQQSPTPESLKPKLTADQIISMTAKQIANSGSPTDEEFVKALKGKFPLSSAQIKTFKERADIAQWDNQEQITVPKPVIATMTANLEPGSIPSVIKISSGYVTSLVFVDENGAPWPIAGYAVGDKDAFQINWDNRSNIMFIQSNKRYASTNIVLQMADLNIPVLFTVVSDQSDVFYRLDIRVPRKGPKSTTSTSIGGGANDSLPRGSNNLTMTNLLDGVAPADAKRLSVEGGKASAWLLDENLLVRTKMTILSPKWNAVVSSADGTHVYQMASSPVVLASDHGRTVQLVMKGQ